MGDIITGVLNVEEILTRIFDDRGFDIHNCRMPDLQRRISRRMDVLEIASLVEYLEYLEANSDEYKVLFNTILVNAGQFFRDLDAWDYVRESILPEILERGDQVRIWSAGCASGEEAYSIAILLAEMLGDNLSGHNIRIYATDVDEAALKFARNGTYTLDQLDGLPEYMREKYFTCHGDTCTINRNIRRLLIFSQNNLVSGTPMSHIDLLLCRNVLIYLDQALQSKVIPKLQYALNDTGYLWLGKAEMLLTDARRFKLLNSKHRIFRKIPFPPHPQFDTMVPAGSYAKARLISANKGFEEVIQNLRTGFILLDRDLNVTMCNQTVQRIWGLPSEQIQGKPFFDLEIAYCSIDLRHRIEHVLTTGESSIVEGVERWITIDEKVFLKVEIIPVVSGVIIFLEDITKQYELREELQTMNRALDTAHERLLSTNQELRTANRQLQAINEVLQSMNEELESTNEELNATNEELDVRVAELMAFPTQEEPARDSQCPDE